MKLVIKIDCDNSSFDDNPNELNHILSRVPNPFELKRKLSETLEEDEMKPFMGFGKLLDSNGNTVGTWSFE